MKKLLGMMSAGRDVSNFFASVVMNIAQDSFEVKVLVYLYLVRTAEQKADEALLSINSFQKDLAHQNPRVRALALRVMSSIRVQVIVPVVILAVRKCAVDPSPYVRKAAAHAIPKVFRLDPNRVDELTEIIETMLRDSTPFVLSSAVAAFQEVCPERIDLVHRHYRKICRMLVDCDEWGQILLANLLLRYARTQFTRPDAYDRSLATGLNDDDDADATTLELVLPGDGGAFEKASSNPLAGTKGFYSSSDSDDDSDDDNSDDADGGESGGSDSDVPRAKKPAAVVKKKSKKKRSKKGAKSGPKGPKPTKDAAAAAADRMTSEWLDDDHRLLLRSSRPLLQSQNTGVVMAAAALQFYLAPVADLPKVLRALVFAIRMKPEAQHIILKNICTMCAVQSSLFQAHFASFFVHPADPVDVRALKLEILTHVVTSDNAAALLRELQSYLRSTNNEFVALTIRAIGRCAAIMPQIAAVCIRSLLELSLHPSEEVAGEAVVVIRALVQQNPKEHAVIVMRLVRRLEMLAAPAARSAVAWLAGGELYIFGEKAAVSLAGKALPEPGTADPSPTTEGPSGFVATQVSMLESSLLDSPMGTNSDAGDERGDAAIDALIAAAAGGEGEDSKSPADATEDAGAGAVAVVDEKAAKRAAKKAEREEKKRLDAANAAKAEAEQREKFFELSFSVLKRSLRNFAHETDVTKLQILNSACKLFIKDANRVGPVLKHVFALCATDPSADMRDRVRIYRAMYAVGGNAAPLAALKEKVVLCDKPAPKLPSPAAPTCVHALGSLSHFVEHVAPGFVALPDHPDVQPPSHVRDQYYNQNVDQAGKGGKKSGKGGFYSDSDESDSDSDSGSDSDSDSGSSGSGSSSSSGSDSSDGSETSMSESSDSDTDDDSDSDSDSGSDSDSDSSD